MKRNKKFRSSRPPRVKPVKSVREAAISIASQLQLIGWHTWEDWKINAVAMQTPARDAMIFITEKPNSPPGFDVVVGCNDSKLMYRVATWIKEIMCAEIMGSSAPMVPYSSTMPVKPGNETSTAAGVHPGGAMPRARYGAVSTVTRPEDMPPDALQDFLTAVAVVDLVFENLFATGWSPEEDSANVPEASWIGLGDAKVGVVVRGTFIVDVAVYYDADATKAKAPLVCTVAIVRGDGGTWRTDSLWHRPDVPTENHPAWLAGSHVAGAICKELNRIGEYDDVAA